MVASARKDNEAAEKRNVQLRSQLNDTEILLASQQEQLKDLKEVMEKMGSERDETETNPHLSTAPSTPGVDTDKMSRILDSLPLSPGMPGHLLPDHPLRFSHLITPVMRTDLPAYNDFVELLKSSRSSHARSSSGNTPISRSASGASNMLSSMSSSSPNLPGSFGASTTSSPREATFSLAPPLKDSKFYKRCLTEDIDPALRLDLAPGLSWLARRTVLNAITAGSLVVEPFVSQSRLYGPINACALCGEDRRQDSYARRHRFRTSEEPSAQRYPLCEYCLGRVRATGDFAGFLRMVRDGLWRAKTDEEVKGAWEESVRLREKMFWARLGGGVIPAASREHKADHHTLSRMDSSTSVRGSQDTGHSEHRLAIPTTSNDPFQSDRKEKRISIGSKVIERTSSDGAGEGGGAGDISTVHDFGAALKTAPTSDATADADAAVSTNEQRNGQSGSESDDAPVTPLEYVERSAHSNPRLSVTIPGSFDD